MALSSASAEAIEHSRFMYTGLDRRDSSRGYDLDNVVPCCRACNVAKNDMTVDEFRAWLLRVYSFWASKPAVI